MAETMKTRIVLKGEPMDDGREMHGIQHHTVLAAPGALVLECTNLSNGCERRRFLLTYNGEEQVLVDFMRQI